MSAVTTSSDTANGSTLRQESVPTQEVAPISQQSSPADGSKPLTDHSATPQAVVDLKASTLSATSTSPAATTTSSLTPTISTSPTITSAMSPLTDGTALPILSISAKKPTLMKEELEKILMREDVKDSPIAVISIAGAFRGGKSFMLDYFLRYLQASPEKRKDGTWMGDKDQPLSGFSWRGGSERNTLGVLMWSEPYFVTLEDGTKIVVLIVDTQGIFDNDSTVSQYSAIFAFSTLISSLIFFNVRENIKEDDLNHLRLFSQFGKLVKSDKGKIYQNLEFLVRDFQYPDETPYGPEGGQQLVDRRLEMKEGQSPELKSVRKDLLASYEKISGFLMPHPGFGVFNPKYDGRWGVLTDDFRIYLNVLVDSIFSPSKIIPRKINGTEVNGKTLFFYIKTFMEVFESDEMPTLQTIAKATIEAMLRLGSTEAREYYQSHMEVETGASKPGLSPFAVNSIHVKVKKEAIDKFLNKQTMADDKEVEPHLAKLQQDLEAHLQDYLITNHVKLQKSLKDGKDAYKAYIKEIYKDSGLCLTPEDLQEAHKNAVTAGRRVFDSNRRQLEGIPDEERESFLKDLEDNYANLRSKNNVNNMIYVNEMLLSYNSALEEYIKKDPPLSQDELERMHRKELSKAINNFSSKRNYTHNSDNDVFKSSLTSKILSSYRNYEGANKIRNKQARQRAYYYYTSKMNDYWDPDNSYYSCASPPSLEEKHEQFKSIALTKLRDGYCSDEECHLLSSMIDSHYDYVKETNNAANDRFLDKAYHIYKSYMDEKTSFSGWWIAGFGIPYLVNKSNRGDYHGEAVDKARNYFRNHRNTYRWDYYYDRLNDRMNYAYNNYY